MRGANNAAPDRCILPLLQHPASPRLRRCRLVWRQVASHFLPVALVAMLTIWSFCWLYLGAVWNPTVRQPAS